MEVTVGLLHARPGQLRDWGLGAQQKQRRAKHIACQTDSTELADLRLLQQQLFDVRHELNSVQQELSHAERRLRHEVRDRANDGLLLQTGPAELSAGLGLAIPLGREKSTTAQQP